MLLFGHQARGVIYQLWSNQKMRFINALLELILAVLLAPSDGASEQAPRSYVGYLISTFSDKNPTVQWYLSKGNDPSTYSFLNKKQPIIRSTVGTRAVRDVFLATNSARDQWFMICTGLETHICAVYKVILTGIGPRSRCHHASFHMESGYARRKPQYGNLEIFFFGALVSASASGVSSGHGILTARSQYLIHLIESRRARPVCYGPPRPSGTTRHRSIMSSGHRSCTVLKIFLTKAPRLSNASDTRPRKILSHSAPPRITLLRPRTQ